MILFLVCLAFTSVLAIELGDSSSLYQNYIGEYAHTYDDYKPRDYEFGYGVSDPHTGDHKSQWEVKEKGVVRGGYSLLEADGTTRVVEYVADDHGFRAVVKKIDHLGNTHVETHGNPEVHQEVPQEVHTQILEPEPIIPEQLYASYDGHVDNYVEPVVSGKIAQSFDLQGFQNDYSNIPVVQKELPYASTVLSQPQYDVPVVPKQISYNEIPQQQAIFVKSQPVYNEKVFVQQQQQPIYDQKLLLKQQPIYDEKLLINQQPIYDEKLLVKQQPIYDENLLVKQQGYPSELSVFIPKDQVAYLQAKAQQTYHQPSTQEVFVQPKVVLPKQQPQYYDVQVPQTQAYYPQNQGYVQETQYQPEYTYNNYAAPQEVHQYVQPVKTLHPHGESSQNYYGTTGNFQDDSSYVNYDTYKHVQ